MKKLFFIFALFMGLAYGNSNSNGLLYMTQYPNGQVKDIVIHKNANTFEIASFYSDGSLNMQDTMNLVYLWMDFQKDKVQKGEQMAAALKGLKSSYSSSLFFTDGTYIYLIATKEVVDTFLGYERK